jgi:hypothetical protein
MNPTHGQDIPDPQSGSEYPADYPSESNEYPAQTDYARQTGYDPGSALVEENLSYGEAGYPDPNQAYYDEEGRIFYYDEHGQPYYAPEQAPEAEPQAYAAPTEYGVYDETPPAPPEAPKKSAPAKKKVGHRAPPRKPSTGGPAVRRTPPKPVVHGDGVSPMTVLLTLIAFGMLAVVVMVAMPKDLSSLGGYAVGLTDGGKPRNILAETQKIMIERNTDLTFTEEEVNRYLNHRLSGTQKGLMAAIVKFRGVYVDFSPAKAEVIVEREIFGRPITMSVDLVTEQFRRQMVYKPAAWHIGKISLGARTIGPVVELFTRLRGSLLDEYHVLQQMSDVRFEDNKVVLDARI